MKRLAFFLLFVAGVATSCTKTIGTDSVTPAVDPRDRLVGTYTIGYNVVVRFGSRVTNPETYTGTLGVSKLQATNQLTLDFDAPGIKEKQTAQLTDSTFTIIDKKTQPIVVNGTTYTGQYSANGLFLREGGQQKMTYTGVSEDTDLKLVITMTGAKK
ncbi:hypothetical protein [uncultured Fibrella sp.]|uniref:hypothetical protein n=1 Tax=uncultured Fibrella sp. TaxID=1284596 RepID=UPI0035CC0E3C